MEGKDGNPKNEVRVLCISMLENDGKLAVNKTIKLKAADSSLGYEVGDEIRVTAADFDRLSEAYYAAIEQAYV